MVDLTAADDAVSIDVRGACEAVDHLPTHQEEAVDGKDLPLDECLRGTETEMLCFTVDRARRQFAWKTGGLDADQLRRRHPRRP